MQFVASAIVFLSQTVDATNPPWWFVALLSLLGGTVGTAAIVKAIIEYLRTKSALAERVANDERAARAEKLKAELQQHNALTDMARSIPTLINEFRDASNRQHEEVCRMVTANTRALADLTGELKSEQAAIVEAMAKKLGVQTNIGETNSSGTRRISTADR